MARETTLDAFVEMHPKIRARFPQVDRDIDGNPRIYLNNAGGTHMADSAVLALAKAAQWRNAQPGALDPGEIATAELHAKARQTAADFLGAGRREEISFHTSTTHALYTVASALRSVLTPENNVIVTDIDHMANVTPWEDIWGRERGYCQFWWASM